jgi:hypothetical protein
MQPARGRILAAGLSSLALIVSSRVAAQAVPPPRIVGTGF